MSLSFGFLFTLLSLSHDTIYASEDVPCLGYHTDFYGIEFDSVTTETYETSEGNQTFEIGWKKMMFCLEGHNDIAHAIQYTAEDAGAYMQLISQYAITVKVTPHDSDPDYFDKAVYGKICHNPIIALNNNKEMSYTINVNNLTTSGPLNRDDWFDYSSGNAVSNLDNDCQHELSPLTVDVIHSCQIHKSLHIQTNDENNQQPVCEWNLRNSNGNGHNHQIPEEISIYFGFDAKRKYVCDGSGTGDLQTVSSLPKPTRRRRAQRRRLHTTEYYDTSTTELYNAPCLRVQVGLESENVLPTNNDPDPQTNIMLVGMGFAGDSTNGVLTFPDIPDPLLSEDPVFTDENTWDVGCVDTTEVEEQYVPTGDPLNFDDAIVASVPTGFTLTVEFTTPDSMLYTFDMDALDLTMTHTCAEPISLSGEVMEVITGEEDVIEDATDTVAIAPNEAATKYSLPFADTLRLYPAKDFRIVITGSYGDAACDLEQITIGSQRRRRTLSLDELQTTPNANACYFLTQLPISPALDRAQHTMCLSNWAELTPVIAGLWRMKNQQVALGNYLIRPGSIRVFRDDGTQRFIDKSWPKTVDAVAIKKPCLAVDETTLRVFAVGGYTGSTPTATDTITVYQFSELSETAVTGGKVAWMEGWKLDQPRYGGMCWYWRKDANTEYIVVISGVTGTTADEFDSSKEFLNDIRLFPVPQDSTQLNFVWTDKTYSKPESGTKWLKNKNVLDSRVMIYDGHILYFWGGKTASSSTDLVSRVDLLDIEQGGGEVTAATAELMRLKKTKAMPMIDKVPLDMGEGEGEKECYAVYMGQSYTAGADGKAVWSEVDEAGDPGLTPNNLQMFCNNNLEPEANVGRRRRLEEIAQFTEYDREMMEKGRRRRLQGDQPAESEVFFRDYHYALDGIWYEMSVEVEVCYATNVELQNALTFYNGIIADKAEDGDNWKDYAADIGSRILAKSKETYSGWSAGFGAVEVVDLSVNNVNEFRCRPVVQIWVNEGCTAENIEYWDTNVRWKEEIAMYTKLYDVVSDPVLLSDAPADSLSQMVLEHSCSSDNDLAAAADGLKVHIMDMEEHHASYMIYGSYPWYYGVIAIMAVYNMIISYSLWCGHGTMNAYDDHNKKMYDSPQYDNII